MSSGAQGHGGIFALFFFDQFFYTPQFVRKSSDDFRHPFGRVPERLGQNVKYSAVFPEPYEPPHKRYLREHTAVKFRRLAVSYEAVADLVHKRRMITARFGEGIVFQMGVKFTEYSPVPLHEFDEIRKKRSILSADLISASYKPRHSLARSKFSKRCFNFSILPFLQATTPAFSF